jgi:hypothetical protein
VKPLLPLIVVALCPLTAAASEDIAQFTLANQVVVRIVEAPFEESGQSFDSKSPCLVGNSIPFGVDCTRPKSFVKHLTVSVNGHTYELDASAMFNAWGGRPLETAPILGTSDKFRYFGGRCVPEGNCVFRGVFSDGAGTFVAEWVVFNGASRRTVLTSADDVVSQIMRNIDAEQ